MAKSIVNSKDITRFCYSRYGVSLLMITISILLTAMTLTYVMPRANRELKRNKEDQLRFILSEFKNATEKFYRINNRFPENIDELIVDSKGIRFLRKKYIDPFTQKSNWVFHISSGSFIIYSASSKKSISGLSYSKFR